MEHRNHRTRFGAAFIKMALAASGLQDLVVDAGKKKDDLVRDLGVVMIRRCARLYGKRSAQNRAEWVLNAIANEK